MFVPFAQILSQSAQARKTAQAHQRMAEAAIAGAKSQQQSETMANFREPPISETLRWWTEVDAKSFDVRLLLGAVKRRDAKIAHLEARLRRHGIAP